MSGREYGRIIGSIVLVGIALAVTTHAAFNAHSEVPRDGDQVDFNRDIRPLLSNRCFKCHGPDDAVRQAGLRLDTFEGATGSLRGGGKAVVAGNAEDSELIRRVTSEDPNLRMPPPDAGDALSDDEIALLRTWIDTGAAWQTHWSFVPPTRSPLPSVSNESWCGNEIDRFVLARLDGAGLAPAQRADRHTLIRRLSLDLIGLPPTREEAAAFVADDSPDAYERVVDRLLASPRFGERWAAVWLDQARYADTMGYEKDAGRTMWPWRDWVIRALNDDMPFDQFTIEQIAGDLLLDANENQRLATAFHRNTMTNAEGGTDNEEFRTAAVVDRVNTTMQVWMGLTAGCAQCHTHKYDPISQQEYYRLFAYFNQTADADRDDDAPLLEIVTSPDDSVLVDQSANEPAADAPADNSPAVPIMQELPADQHRTTRVLVRGSFLNPAQVVSPGTPEALHAMSNDARQDRLGLAHWLVSETNPLAARVFVNRIWSRVFGLGLVESEEDFGVQGLPPSHTALLDHLAIDFMDNGWRLKPLLRDIVLSSSYQQASNVTPNKLERDPRNRLLSRGARHRLPAEMVRDQALAVSGLLSDTMYGPPVYPPQPDGIWQVVYSNASWQTSTGDDRYRRGLYTYWRRTSPYPAMANFDSPSREFCVPRRIRTNTPLQAFTTLNDPAFVEMAQALSRRIVREGGADTRARSSFALETCLARPALPEEIDTVVRLFESEFAHYREHAEAAITLATDPLGPIPDNFTVNAPELAAWTVVANTIMNLDEFLTRN